MREPSRPTVYAVLHGMHLLSIERNRDQEYPGQPAVSAPSAMLATMMHGPDPAALQTPEEIHIGKLLHLLHIAGLGHLLIVEQHPRCRLLVRYLFADECDVMPVVVSDQLASSHAPIGNTYPA